MSNIFKPLPKRYGKIIGRGEENQMIDSVGGPDGVRKKIRNNGDGSQTMLKTGGGHPRFTSNGKSKCRITMLPGYGSYGGMWFGFYFDPPLEPGKEYRWPYRIIDGTAKAGAHYIPILDFSWHGPGYFAHASGGYYIITVPLYYGTLESTSVRIPQKYSGSLRERTLSLKIGCAQAEGFYDLSSYD